MSEVELRRYPMASGLAEAMPVLVETFPEYWIPRLARGRACFPYDVQLYTAHCNGVRVGVIGVHDYRLRFGGTEWLLAGISDVGVRPAWRGRGVARAMLAALLRRCFDGGCCGAALYTEKPRVYRSSGFAEYTSAAPSPVPGASAGQRRLGAGELAEVQRIYGLSADFPGKCVRSRELWEELADEPANLWRLGAEGYELYHAGTLWERHAAGGMGEALAGGLDANRLMLCPPNGGWPEALGTAIAARTLCFPIADTF